MIKYQLLVVHKQPVNKHAKIKTHFRVFNPPLPSLIREGLGVGLITLNNSPTKSLLLNNQQTTTQDKIKTYFLKFSLNFIV